VALQLFLGMGKPNTGNADEKVLVWGAGGAVGTYAVQYAKSVSGFMVSSGNCDFMKAHLPAGWSYYYCNHVTS
jgi:NADPH:quinone reductase-like Zn-dependent oxidoreductase